MNDQKRVDAIKNLAKELNIDLPDYFFNRAINQPAQTKGLTAFTDEYTLAQAIDRIRQELQKDKEPGSYYHTWQCNLAMCFYDAYKNRFPTHAEHTNAMENIHSVANKAAENFINILCLTNDNKQEPPKQSGLQV